MSDTDMHRCEVKGCRSLPPADSYLCDKHMDEWAKPAPPRSHDYEAARLDPTTDRDRWDAWDDGGLEAPGEDEF